MRETRSRAKDVKTEQDREKDKSDGGSISVGQLEPGSSGGLAISEASH